MLTFTTFSLFLGGLAAVVLPVLFHFLMQGKPKQIEFPALMFISNQIETHRRNYQLKHLLLLALRILAFALIGFALARPVLKISDYLPDFSFFSSQSGYFGSLVTSLGSQDAPVAAAIVIDNSVRMDYVAENKTRLKVAQEYAQWILKQLPQNSSVAVLSCDHETSVFQVDVLSAENKISRLQTSPLGKPVCEVVQSAAALLLESPLEQKELYVLSDLSKPAWNANTASLELGNIAAYLVDVSVKQPVNSSIQRVVLNPEAATAKAPTQLDVTVSHIGTAATKSVQLVLIGNANDPNAETVRLTKAVDFPDGESRRSVPMQLSGFEAGTYQGKVRFSAGDALAADDQCWFTLQVQARQKFLILSQPPVRDTSLYLKEALETVPIEVETLPVDDLTGLTINELQKYQAVILLDPPPLNAALWNKLTDYAADGFGVAVFLGQHCDSLASFNAPQAKVLLGAKLVRQSRVPDGDLWLLPALSPVFSPFRAINEINKFAWETQQVYRYWELNELAPQVGIAATFSDQRPAILTQMIGRGHTVTVATPVSETADARTPWNTWTRGEASWMFVLLTEGIAKYLTGTSEQKFNFQTGEPIVIPLLIDAASIPASCQLGMPDSNSVRITPDAARRLINIGSTKESGASVPGNYRIRSGGNKPLDIGLSVNLQAGLTDLSKASTAFPKGMKVIRTPQEIEQSIARQRIGSEIYPLLMILLCCVFAGEYLFANRFYR